MFVLRVKIDNILSNHRQTIKIIYFYLDDILGPNDDLSNVAFEDDAFDELQAVVNKTMKLKTKKDSVSNEKV